MKYRVRERVQGDGTKLYDVQWKDDCIFGFLSEWRSVYERGGLMVNRNPKTLNDCLQQIAAFQQEDRDKAIKSTRYVATGLDIIIHPQDNDKDKANKGY